MDFKPHKTVTLVIGETTPPVPPTTPGPDDPKSAAAPAPASTYQSRMLTLNKGPQPRSQSATIRHHDTAVDVMDAYGIPTDGSQVILKPGTNVPFEADEVLYDEVEDKSNLLVVTNVPGQVGEGAALAPVVPSKVAPVRGPFPPPADGGVVNQVGYPKLLQDSSGKGRPDVLVHNQDEEVSSRRDGFTNEIPAPAGVTTFPVTAGTGFPKTLKDTSSLKRPNVTVNNSDEEADMRRLGFTVEVPTPAGV